MTAVHSSDRTAWAIPPEALTEWLTLFTLVDEIGAVPCRTNDPEAWWPDGKSVRGPAAQMAVDGCWRCPAREACLDYAVAANEREGVWGGLLPDERMGILGRGEVVTSKSGGEPRATEVSVGGCTHRVDTETQHPEGGEARDQQV